MTQNQNLLLSMAECAISFHCNELNLTSHVILAWVKQSRLDIHVHVSVLCYGVIN